MTDRGDILSYGSVKEVAPILGYKQLYIQTASSFIGGTDTFTIDLTGFGCRNVAAIFATFQSTAGQVLAASTASVSATTAGVATVGTAASGTGVYGIILYAY